MKVLCELTDKSVLGIEGYSYARPRRTARAILRSSEGLYAVMYAAKFGLYSLPGGGIEAGETSLEALRREILEETGCVCGKITELGCVKENRAHCDYVQESDYYLVEAICSGAPAALTKSERENKTELQWHTFEDMLRLITSPVHETNQRKFLQARDAAALEAYAEQYKGGVCAW